MSDRKIPEAVARFLRQRRELGDDSVYLDGLTREEVLEAAARARRGETGVERAPDGAHGSGSRGGAAADAGGVEVDGEEARRIREGEAGEAAVKELDYDALETVALECRRCRLAGERTQVVFSDGNPGGRLMVVGEAPGAREDETGLPFVGPAGKLLDLLLGAVDLSREKSVYICNVIKCRPPGNRNPKTDEIQACAPYLRRQVDLVAPEAILAVGKFAGQLLTGSSSSLGRMRGEVYSYEGVPLVVTYHPAALLRNASWTRATWDDFQLVRQILDGG